MAKFICASMEKRASGTCAAALCAGIFSDVSDSNPFCAYIEALYANGIVAGCQASPLKFCPSDFMQRQAMAKFLCLAKEETNPDSCSLLPCSGIFNDVTSGNAFCSFIEALYSAGIALANVENRPVGIHNHAVNDPGHLPFLMVDTSSVLYLLDPV
ncbi:MAG: hypothetical protein A2Y62_03330 [Candidatus Fischerbacteria bacterium RBG_13_37_8]|uniref:SLH domain-containing protein n=1 Tax=Candidatus Fischerbacteria bacterium RBG_13_37_8 TaxID=1817863 RepID=A0A1F5VK45_9BACT|nr:MAG: hypothetical protein A2Y62_03330 [Candidatus Fischerbacteria bacterium RBG_13_37_8]